MCSFGTRCEEKVCVCACAMTRCYVNRAVGAILTRMVRRRLPETTFCQSFGLFEGFELFCEV